MQIQGHIVPNKINHQERDRRQGQQMIWVFSNLHGGFFSANYDLHEGIKDERKTRKLDNGVCIELAEADILEAREDEGNIKKPLTPLRFPSAVL